MAVNYIKSAEETMLLIRRIAAHLAVEPNLPASENLTRGEVDAWIRALDTGLHGRVIDFLSIPVLECLLYMKRKSGVNILLSNRHLKRAPFESFAPVIVNPWVREDVTVVHERMPWIPGDRRQARKVNHEAEDLAVANEQTVVEQESAEDAEEDADAIRSRLQGVQLNGTQQNGHRDHDTVLETTEQNTDDQNTDDQDTTDQVNINEGAIVLFDAAAAETAQNTTMHTVDDSDITMQDQDLTLPEITMQDAPPGDNSQDPSSPHTNPSHEENSSHSTTTTTSSSTTADDYEPNSAHDPTRILWCICNSSENDTMILCNNHTDPNCKGKWYHTPCVGLARPPAKNVDWYCVDCRRKLGLGVYSNGCVGGLKKC